MHPPIGRAERAGVDAQELVASAPGPEHRDDPERTRRRRCVFVVGLIPMSPARTGLVLKKRHGLLGNSHQHFCLFLGCPRQENVKTVCTRLATIADFFSFSAL